MLFRSIRKQPSQLSNSSVACKDQIVFSGFLSRNTFRPASPYDRNIILTAFLFAASSGLYPRSAFTVGFFVSFAVLVNSLIEMEYLAIIATANISIHFFHSIDIELEASYQDRGSPTNNEFVDAELDDDDEVDARSAML